MRLECSRGLSKRGGRGKVSEQAALYAPRILKPIIWLNSFCNYPKGSACYTPNVAQTTSCKGQGGRGSGSEGRRVNSSGSRGSNPFFLQADRKRSNLRTRQEVGPKGEEEGRQKEVETRSLFMREIRRPASILSYA